MLDLLDLAGPVGRGMPNSEDDVEAFDSALRRVGAYEPPSEYQDAPQRYATAPMIDALEHFQEQNRLKKDGYANPGGPTERAINNQLLRKPRGAGLLFEAPAPLSRTVGNGFENDRRDVQHVQRMLGALDYLPEDPFDRPHGFIDEPTTNAVKGFQRDKGLGVDGWLRPGGETENALHEAVSDLARVKGRDWFAFAERAGRAQAAFRNRLAQKDGYSQRLSVTPLRAEDDSDGDATTPVGWAPTTGLPRENADRAPAKEPHAAENNEDAKAVPAQTAPGDWIVPWLFLALPPLLGLGESRRRESEVQRQDIDESERSGGKHENIPPQKSNEPYRGRDLAKPPLDPRSTGPSPYPSEPPKLPDREEIRPETLKPEDWILITPERLQIAAKDLILRMRGNERTQGRLTRLREVGESVASERTDVRLIHIGGAHDKYGINKKEFYAPNPLRGQLGIKTTKGAAFADLTFQDKNTGQLYHISLYRVSSGTIPLPVEIAQAHKLAINKEGETKLIVMVPNVRGDDFVDEKAFKRFLHTTLDALRGAPRATNMSDQVMRDRVIRYFAQITSR